MFSLTYSRCLPAVLVAFGILTGTAGCGNAGADPRGMRVAAEGTVLLGNEPISAARIMFIVDQGAGAVRASALIKDGTFSFDEKNGPLVGDARVEIHPVEMELEELEAARGGDPTMFVNPLKVWIPPQYNKHSKLTAHLTEDPEENQFEFRLASN